MLDAPLIWSLAIRIPALFTGGILHRAALHATAARAYPAAEALFERAAGHYRMDLEVEALARLRVHQLIARLRAGGAPERVALLRRDIEQRLARLEYIESLDPPFTRVPASRLLADCGLEPLQPAPAAGGGAGSATLDEAA